MWGGEWGPGCLGALQVPESGADAAAAGSQPCPRFRKTSTDAVLGSLPWRLPAPAERLLLPRDQHSPHWLPPSAPRQPQPLCGTTGTTSSQVQPGWVQTAHDTASSRMNSYVCRPHASPCEHHLSSSRHPRTLPHSSQVPEEPSQHCPDPGPTPANPFAPRSAPTAPCHCHTTAALWFWQSSTWHSQARACLHWPAWVLREPRTCVCVQTSSLTQPSLIGSQEHNFSSNYIFSTSEKMRFW